MAIVKMKHLTLIAENKHQAELLNEVMWLSSVDVTPLTEDLYEGLLKKDENINDNERCVSEVKLLEKTIDILTPYSTVTRSIFSKPYELSRKDFNDFGKKHKDIIYLANSVIDIQNQINIEKIRENKMRTLILSLQPWKSFPLEMNTQNLKYCNVEIGSIPTEVDFDLKLQKFYEQADNCYVEKLSGDNEQLYVALIYLKSDEEKVYDALSPLHFSAVNFKDLYGTVDDNIILANEQAEQAVENRDNLVAKLKEYAKRLSEVEQAFDIISNTAQISTVRDNLLKSKNTFLLEGWCPIKKIEKLQQLLDKYVCYYEFNDPTSDDDPPILLKNNFFASAFEPITKMYALPVYGGIDPNFALSPFFFIFFGLMLGDVGYGGIVTIICLLALSFGHFRESMKKNLKMFTFCGISTMFWGLMFGSFFGDVIPVFSETFLGNRAAFNPLWFNPLENPLLLLGISFALGYIHIMTGMFMKAWMLIKNKKYLDAIFDVGFWVMILIGLPLLASGAIGLPPVVGTVGMYIAIAGAIGLILSQGRDKKNPISKLLNGILSLYDITGFLSDVLSYSRILALGLSTTVIGSVFNKLATLLGGGISGFILFIIVFAFGTVLNLALSTLSAYVHSSRLQFIEFFSKFYESGGREFDALKVDTKYSEIK